MGVEPWGLYPPEINAGRFESGIGAPTFIAGAVEWSLLTGILAEMTAALGAQFGVMTGNWAGAASGAFGAGAVPYAAWLSEMQAMAIRRAAANVQVVESWAAGMVGHVPLAVIIANRIEARAAQVASALGAPTPMAVTAEIEYAAYWVHNATVMTGYDVAVNTATAPTPVPPPPPLVIDGGAPGAGLDSAAQQVMSQLNQGSSAMSQAMSSAGGQAYAGAQPGTGDAAMWSDMLGGGPLGGGGGLDSPFAAGDSLASGGGAGGGAMAGGFVPPSLPTAAMATPMASTAGGVSPAGAFGGVSPASSATRASMPMMPPPHAAGSRRKSAPGARVPVSAAFNEFPIASQQRLENAENTESEHAFTGTPNKL